MICSLIKKEKMDKLVISESLVNCGVREIKHVLLQENNQLPGGNSNSGNLLRFLFLGYSLEWIVGGV